MDPATRSPAWQALVDHHRSGQPPMRELFRDDPGRFDAFSLRLGDLLLDFSKNRLTRETLDLLLALARERGVEAARDRMLLGEAVNESEGRAALHTALRGGADPRCRVAGHAGVAPGPLVDAALERMTRFVDEVRGGRRTGATGKPFTTVVNIGIGGSDMGPKLLCRALRPYHLPGLRPRFAANIDGADLAEALAGLDPATTLFVVSSKSFGTEETLTNARSARRWLATALGEDAVARHFVAVSANAAAVAEFGIPEDGLFPIWDWVGGRYSVWSAIGLPAALTMGMPVFHDFLLGARRMDRHFADAPLARNLPVVLALVGIWNRNFLGAASHAVVPYDHDLNHLPAYLQQLEMESNGKSVNSDGEPAGLATAPVLFGGVGTPGQHTFHQLLHQGTDPVAVDFIAAVEAPQDGRFDGEHHARLLANFLAQGEALMRGRTIDEVRAALTARGIDETEVDRLAPHRTFPGDRPSNAILLRRLDAENLGMLLALYEHKVFVQAAIWGINPFDQWGVELGKELAGPLLATLTAPGAPDPADGKAHDSSTLGLLRYICEMGGAATGEEGET